MRRHAITEGGVISCGLRGLSCCRRARREERHGVHDLRPRHAGAKRQAAHVLRARAATCGGCGAALEGRVVLRDGAVVMLKHCLACGPTEGAGRRRRAGLGAGVPRPRRRPGGLAGDHLFKQTTSTCPTCLALMPADVVIRDGRVYFKKTCADVRPVGGAGLRGRALLRSRLRLRARRHRAAEVRGPRRARLPDRLRHLRRPRAAHLPADHRDHRPLQPRVPDLHRRQPVLAPHGAARRSRRSSTGWSPTRASARRSRCRAASRPATRGILELIDIATPGRDRPRRGHHQRPAPRPRSRLRRGAQGAGRLRRPAARRLQRRDATRRSAAATSPPRRRRRSRCSRSWGSRRS